MGKHLLVYCFMRLIAGSTWVRSVAIEHPCCISSGGSWPLPSMNGGKLSSIFSRNELSFKKNPWSAMMESLGIPSSFSKKPQLRVRAGYKPNRV